MSPSLQRETDSFKRNIHISVAVFPKEFLRNHYSMTDLPIMFATNLTEISKN
jgi:hypothetical protein